MTVKSKPKPIRREVSARLLLDDTWPLHLANEAGRASFAIDVNESIGRYFDVVMTPADVRRLTLELAERYLQRGDFCVVPFMSAACIYEAVVALDVPGVVVLPLPLSRHPFWSFMPPCPESDGVLKRYEALAAEFMTILALIVESGVFSRMVYFDSNSATGRDFEMIRRLVDEMSGGRIASQFLVLCNETTENSLEVGPGYRGGRKIACPDHWALRLIDHNVKYLSHLYLLLRFSSGELEDMAAAKIDEHPKLFAFWNDERVRKHSPHGYGPLGEGASWKSRLRFAQSETSLSSNQVDPAGVEALRRRFHLNKEFVDTTFHADPRWYWTETINSFRS